MLGRNAPKPPPPSTVEDELLRLRARVDQVLALADEAMRQYRGNRPLVDLCLDVKNTLTARR